MESQNETKYTEMVLEVSNRNGELPYTKSNSFRSKYLCFTYQLDIDEDPLWEMGQIFADALKLRTAALSEIRNLGCEGVIGIERGEEKLRVHLQGYIECHRLGKNGIQVSRFTVLAGDDSKVWWGKKRKTRLAAASYCIKDGCYGIVGKDMCELLGGEDTEKKWKEEIDELYDWQKEIVELLCKTPDKRTIMWYFEPVGQTGKTTFGKWLYTHPELVGKKLVVLSGKGADMKNGVISYQEKNKCLPRTVIMNVPRTYQHGIQNPLKFRCSQRTPTMIRNLDPMGIACRIWKRRFPFQRKELKTGEAGIPF